MKGKHLLVALVIAGAICGIVGYIGYTLLHAPSEKSFQSLSEADKQRLVDAVCSLLEDHGLMDEIVGFGYTKDGFEILFKEKTDPQVIAIVREGVGELPLNVIENATCTPIPATIIPPEEWTPHTPPTKPPSAYHLNVTFSSMPVTVMRGGSVTLPVAVSSFVDDEPIRIRLALESSPDWEVPLPEFIKYETEGYLTVNPHETVQTQITIKASEDAPLTELEFCLCGELKKTLEEYGGECNCFSLSVESAPTPGPTPATVPTWMWVVTAALIIVIVGAVVIFSRARGE